MGKRYVITRYKADLYMAREGVPQWIDVEIGDKIRHDIIEKMMQVQKDYEDLHTYFNTVYPMLRQNGGADISKVEVPKCVQSSSSKSPKPSTKRASRTSTKPKATNSTSPSSGDTDVSTAPASE